MDEKEGPYKVVQSIADSRTGSRYSIVKQSKQSIGTFFQEIVPNAGTGETARLLCNLLNKNYKEKRDEEVDEAPGADERGLDDPGL